MITKTEKLLKAKIPCAETGIEIRKSICDICTPACHCGLDVYVKDDTVLKVEGADDFPSGGKLCTKGLANRGYIYRKDRIQTPLLRIGDKGSGQFQKISWDGAYRIIADNFNSVKEESGAESVAWYVGYEKWCRTWVQRLAYSFGSPNYGTESSTCHFSAIMAAISTLGTGVMRNDIEHTDLYVGWGSNPFMNMYPTANALIQLKERGGKIIIVDPRRTMTTEKLADLHIQLCPGTDGALALGLANYFIKHNMYNAEFVGNYVSGFEEYSTMVSEYTLENVSRITDVPVEKIQEMAELYGRAEKACAYVPSSSITHHTNGFNSIRNIYCLQALLGHIDQEGGDLPTQKSFCQMGCGFQTLEDQFAFGTKPEFSVKRVGEEKFPLWGMFSAEMQATELCHQIMEEKPYPIKALMNFGMNHRMFPQPSKMLEALDKLDFVVSVDLFMTETCKHSDLILPACSSMERSELKGWPGGFLTYTQPVIQPLYESRSDVQIVCELANYLDIDDDLLKQGEEATLSYMISNLSVSLEELKKSAAPLRVKEAQRYEPGTLLKKGFGTRSKKIELFSGAIASAHGRAPYLNPLPIFEEDDILGEKDKYPLNLVTGARIPNAIHSRLHLVPIPRSLRPEPLCEVHPETAKKYGIKDGKKMKIMTVAGELQLKAKCTATVRKNDIYIFHGYEEADANELIPQSYRDKYSGFPGYGRINCAIEKVDEEENDNKF